MATTDPISGIPSTATLPPVSTAPINGTNSGTVSGGSALSQLSGNYTMFLKLLTAQLQYQDPLAPTDSTTYTQQLVSYSQVEQQIKTNDQLGSLVNVSKANGNSTSALLDYLGRYAEVSGTDFALQNGSAYMSYSLDKSSPSVTIDIMNKDDAKVASFTSTGKAGAQQVVWDGTDNEGNQLPDGAYKMSITALDSKGDPIAVSEQSMMGKVTGIEKGTTGNTLSFGGMHIDESKILNIYNSPGDKVAA
ncbi:MAG: flagellar hook capping FlgD N-terminal domain-containing protein [Alphaproteobacteria bacterium]